MYLKEDGVCRWNVLKHVTSNILHTGASGSIGGDMREIQHAALDMRERGRDSHGRPSEPSSDVDNGAQPPEDVAALLDDDVHDEAAVTDHPLVEELAEGRVVVVQVPRCLPMRHLKQGRIWVLLLEPRAEAKERGHEDPMQHQGQEGSQAW